MQTDFPDHPLYVALVGHDYDGFAETLLAERERLDLPPFAHLALLSAEAPGREAVTAFLERAVAHGRALLAASELRCEVYSPVPAGLARRAWAQAYDDVRYAKLSRPVIVPLDDLTNPAKAFPFTAATHNPDFQIVRHAVSIDERRAFYPEDRGSLRL